jgi:hypothetical protein
MRRASIMVGTRAKFILIVPVEPYLAFVAENTFHIGTRTGFDLLILENADRHVVMAGI